MFLCGKISEVEWSGVLFYSVKGSIKQFDEVEFILEDIYPMNKGTKAYTEYELDDDLIDYRMSNPKSLTWKVGMIHSHNSMKSYFSGTDMSELNDNSEFHNYYLSLIVNNFGEMVAKIAFRGEAKGFECKDEKGENWNLHLKKSRQMMFTFDLDIQLENKIQVVEDEFSKRVAQIIENSEKAKKIIAEQWKKQQEVQKQQYFKPQTFPTHPNYNQKYPKKTQGKEWEFDNSNFMDDFDVPPLPVKDFSKMAHEERLKDFAAFVLRLGYDAKPGDDIESALTDLFVSEVNIFDFVAKILNQYPALFEKYWDGFGSISTEFFTDVTEEIISEYEEFYDVFEIVEHLAGGLHILLNRLISVEDE